jgi:nucleoside-diphosphate-sugar epimerase
VHPRRGEVAGTVEAIHRLESLVRAAPGLTGTVLRYGAFYGPGTSIGPGGDLYELVRRRLAPVVGNGGGVWSFVHIDDAAEATRLAIERDTPGLFNIVDDEPAEVSVWPPREASAGLEPDLRHLARGIPSRPRGWRACAVSRPSAAVERLEGFPPVRVAPESGWRYSRDLDLP